LVLPRAQELLVVGEEGARAQEALLVVEEEGTCSSQKEVGRGSSQVEVVVG
jgi:hypothetical protein